MKKYIDEGKMSLSGTVTQRYIKNSCHLRQSDGGISCCMQQMKNVTTTVIL